MKRFITLFMLTCLMFGAASTATADTSPSYQQGFARSAAESARPQDWPGLVGFYPLYLGATGARIPDYSGLSNNGTLTGITPDASWQRGKFNTALYFTIDDYVNIPTTPSIGLDGQNKATFMAWINPDSLGQSSQGRILDKGGGSSVSSGYTFGLSPPTGISLQVNSVVGDWLSISALGMYALGEWAQVVAVYDGVAGNVDFYSNGKFVSSDAIEGSTSIAANTYALRIGNRATDVARDFDGRINEVRIYNRALTAQHIQQIYQDPLGIVQMADTHSISSIQEVAASPTSQIIIISWIGGFGALTMLGFIRRKKPNAR